MKKVLSLILAIAMAMTALTGIALAEATETTEAGSELNELMNLLGSLTNEKGTEGGEEFDLSALLGMLGGLLDKGEAGAEGENNNGGKLTELLGMLGGMIGSKDAAAENGGESGMSALLDTLGGLFNGAEEGTEVKSDAETEQGADLSGLMGMLGGTKEAADYPKAESADQFFGTWKLAKTTFLGEEIPPTEETSTTLIINEKGIFFDKVDDTETELVLKEGHLSLGEKGAVIIHLTETGICFSLAGILDMDFVAAE